VTVYTAIFYFLCAVILAATAMAITRRQPVQAVLYLVVAFLGTAALFFLLGAPLIAALVVIIYAGAILVLFLFFIMLFKGPGEGEGIRLDWGAALFLGGIFAAVVIAVLLKDPGSGALLQGAVALPGDFGHFLFSRYWLAVEIVSLLLLVALVAIMNVGRKEAAGENEGAIDREEER
jgi:NADH-quinone oxidoreductase subunit J